METSSIRMRGNGQIKTRKFGKPKEVVHRGSYRGYCYEGLYYQVTVKEELAIFEEENYQLQILTSHNGYDVEFVSGDYLFFRGVDFLKLRLSLQNPATDGVQLPPKNKPLPIALLSGKQQLISSCPIYGDDEKWVTHICSYSLPAYKQQWAQPIDGYNFGLVVTQRYIYCITEHHLKIHDSRTGDQVALIIYEQDWRGHPLFELAERAIRSLTETTGILGSMLFVGTCYGVVGFDIDELSIVWVRPEFSRGKIYVTEDGCVFVQIEGGFEWLDPNTGETIRKTLLDKERLGEGNIEYVELSNTHVIVSVSSNYGLKDKKRMLYGLNRITGNVDWDFVLDTGIFSAELINNRLYISSFTYSVNRRFFGLLKPKEPSYLCTVIEGEGGYIPD